MTLFALTLNGFPALLLILAVLYVVVFLPIKLITIVSAHAKAKAAKLQQLHANTIVAEYDPPKGLKPAELGELYDSKTGLEELFATIVQLEQRGLVTVSQDHNQLIVGAVSAALPADLDAYESYIVQTLGPRTNSPITEQLLESMLLQFKLLLGQTIRAKGYRVSWLQALKGMFRRILLLAGSFMLLTGLAFHPKTAEGIIVLLVFLVFFWPGYMALAFVLYYTYQKIAGQTWTATAQLHELWPEIEGYRQYIQEVELDSLKFENGDLKQHAQNSTIPYAIALGLNTGWRQWL